MAGPNWGTPGGSGYTQIFAEMRHLASADFYVSRVPPIASDSGFETSFAGNLYPPRTDW